MSQLASLVSHRLPILTLPFIDQLQLMNSGLYPISNEESLSNTWPRPHGGFNGTPKVYKWNSDVGHRAVVGFKHNTVEVYGWDPVEIDGGEAGQFMM